MQTKIANDAGDTLTVNYSETNVHIDDSYAVDKKNIADWVSRIMDYARQNGYIYSRSEKSWMNEWKAHNLLFKWGVAPNRTRDVDLNEDESWLKRFCYFILSIIY